MADRRRKLRYVLKSILPDLPGDYSLGAGMVMSIVFTCPSVDRG
jgi:hypothetical protein